MVDIVDSQELWVQANYRESQIANIAIGAKVRMKIDAIPDISYIGTIESKVDGKGRVFLPSVFRKAMQSSGVERLVLRKDVLQPCLVLYTVDVWASQLAALRSRLNRWNADHQMVLRQFLSDVEVLPIDGNGRILVPRRYLRMASIEQCVRFVGMDDTIELWRGGDDKPFMEPAAFGAALEQIMSNDTTNRQQ